MLIKCIYIYIYIYNAFVILSVKYMKIAIFRYTVSKISPDMPGWTPRGGEAWKIES